MSYALNNVTAPDAYGAPAELLCPKAVRVRVFVSNQAVYWQRGQKPNAAEK